MLQTVLGKLYPISLFVILEGRATLAVSADRTHFPTLTGANRHVVSAWSVKPGEVDQTDVLKLSDVPLEFAQHKTVSSDPGAEGNSSTFDPETTEPHHDAVHVRVYVGPESCHA